MKSVASAVTRLHYLDWLRVLAILGVFLFHNARLFDAHSGWHVKDAATNGAATFMVGFAGQWIMPLFFLISGAGTYYALRSRTVAKYIQDRTLRLLVPLVFGMLVIVVPQAYFEALFEGTDLRQYNVFEIYWMYLKTLPETNWFHLWFLWYLFVGSIVAIPLFFGWRNRESIAILVSKRLTRPWLLFLAAIASITLINLVVFPDGFWGHRELGGWNLITYMLFFILGYVLFGEPKTMNSVARLRWAWLGGALASAALLVVFLSAPLEDPAGSFGSVEFVAATLVQSIHTWCWLFAMLGFAARYLNRSNAFLVYGNEGVLPFYVLHQTVIVSIGYFVVQWSAGIGPKYAIIAAASFTVTMLLYEMARRVNLLRFLLGMRLARKAPLKTALGGLATPPPAA